MNTDENQASKPWLFYPWLSVLSVVKKTNLVAQEA